MPTVHLQPHDMSFEAQKGATVLEAARESGIFWPSTCGGQGRCTTCAMRVIAGHENLSEPTDKETAQLAPLATLYPTDCLRLACQARVRGDVVVYKTTVVL